MICSLWNHHQHMITIRIAQINLEYLPEISDNIKSKKSSCPIPSKPQTAKNEAQKRTRLQASLPKFKLNCATKKLLKRQRSRIPSKCYHQTFPNWASYTSLENFFKKVLIFLEWYIKLNTAKPQNHNAIVTTNRSQFYQCLRAKLNAFA